ncbi:MAG TPA: hypothetical protein VKT70_10375 [Stellaceae bacterium]|nr:hypothetical protein [Stellaceae bacterium]
MDGISHHGTMKRNRSTFASEIIAILAFKAIALAFLYVAFFSPSHRLTMTPERAAFSILGYGRN